MALLRTLLFSLIFYLGSIPYVLLAAIGVFLSKKLLRAIVRGWTRYHYFCMRWILGINIKIVGQLPNRPVLYAVKHESMFEAIDMPRLLAEPAVIMKQELAKIPLWGFAAKRYGMIAVDRNAGASAMREMIGTARAMVAAGRPIVIFPEGTRVAHGQKPPLLPGFVGLYKLLALPVVPIAINSGKLIPRNGYICSSGTITYQIGAEIPPGLPREEIEARVHSAMNALNP